MHSNPYFLMYIYTHVLSIQYSSQDSHPLITDKSQRRFLSLAPLMKSSLLNPPLP